MTKQPKLALLSSLNNEEQRGGAYLRVYALIKIYEHLGFHVDVFYMEQWSPSRSYKGEFCRLYFQKDVRILFTQQKIDLSSYDYVHYDNLRFFQWDIKLRESAYLIYNAHNLEFESYYLRNEQHKAACLRFKKFEMKVIKRANLILTCSQREKSILSKAGVDNSKVYVVPNLIDRRFYHSSKPKKTILFLGTLDYYPNIKAVEYLCEQFLPRIPIKLKQDFKYVIAGRNPSPELKEKVEKCGGVLRANLSQSDIYQLLSESRVSLVPLEHGSGTRLKIVESLFSGAIVLSTPLGAEGFEQEDSIKIAELEDFVMTFEKMLDEKEEASISDSFLLANDLTMWIEGNLHKLSELLRYNN